MVVQLKPTLPVLLSFNGGYVDTAGILTKLLALLARIVARSMPEGTVSHG